MPPYGPLGSSLGVQKHKVAIRRLSRAPCRDVVHEPVASGAYSASESEPVPKRIRYGEVTCVPGRVRYLWSSIGVVSRAQFGAERVHILDFDAHRRARRRIAMVLGQMQVAVTSADAHVERCAVVEPVFEYHLEPKKGYIELACLNFVKASQDGGGAA